MLEYNFFVNFSCFHFASRLHMIQANARAVVLVGCAHSFAPLALLLSLLVPFEWVEIARSPNVVASNSPLYGRHLDVIFNTIHLNMK